MSKSDMTKRDKAELEKLKEYSNKSRDDLTTFENSEFRRISIKSTEASEFKGWASETEKSIEDLEYSTPFDAIPLLYDKRIILKALYEAITKSDAIALLDDDFIPPIIPVKTSINEYLFNIEYNFLIYSLAYCFKPECRRQFLADFKLSFKSRSAYRALSERDLETEHSRVKMVSNILEFLKISYLNPRSVYKAMSYQNSSVALNYYTPIVVKKIADSTGKEAVQLNCIPIKESFINELAYNSDDLRYSKARAMFFEVAELVSQKLKIVASNTYDCNRFWILRALKMSNSEFEKLSKAKRGSLLSDLAIERHFYS